MLFDKIFYEHDRTKHKALQACKADSDLIAIAPNSAPLTRFAQALRLSLCVICRDLERTHKRSDTLGACPGIDNEIVADKIIASFKDAGVKLSKKETIGIVDEGAMGDDIAMPQPNRLSL